MELQQEIFCLSNLSLVHSGHKLCALWQRRLIIANGLPRTSLKYIQIYMYVYVYICIYPIEGSPIVCQTLHSPLLSPRAHIYHHSAHQTLSDDDIRYSFYGNLLCKPTNQDCVMASKECYIMSFVELKSFLNFCNCLRTARICTPIFSMDKPNSSYITLHRSIPTQSLRFTCPGQVTFKSSLYKIYHVVSCASHLKCFTWWSARAGNFIFS